jgi:putative phosphoesterase
MIGVMSDSHDNVTMVRRAVSLFRDAHCDLVLHAGDIIAPFAARELPALGCPVKAVFGNCDGEKDGLKKIFEDLGEIEEAPLVFSYQERRFLLCHYHFAVEPYASSNQYDIIVFGHTHKPEIKISGRTLLLNPGETGGWLTGKSTVALLDPGKKEAEIVPL